MLAWQFDEEEERVGENPTQQRKIKAGCQQKKYLCWSGKKLKFLQQPLEAEKKLKCPGLQPDTRPAIFFYDLHF